MKFPPISWVIAGTVLAVISLCLNPPASYPYALIGAGAMLYGAIKGMDS